MLLLSMKFPVSVYSAKNVSTQTEKVVPSSVCCESFYNMLPDGEGGRNEKVGRSERKKRDRLTVLKALSSTVGKIPNKPDYRFFDDMILNPRSLIKQKEMLLAIESGKKAADYVLEKYPELFPLREAVPAWPKDVSRIDDLEETVDNLQLLMKNGDNVMKVIDLYEKLKENDELTIDVHNDMLDFVSFHAVGGSHEQQNADVDTSSSSSSSSSDEEKSLSTKESETTDEQISSWRSDGYAEKLFAELKEQANSRTYEVFIMGLLKHGEQLRAFHLFREFEQVGNNGSLFFYNSLLAQVCNVREGDENRWDLVQEIVASMKRSAVAPNVVTYNTLLDVAVQMNDNAHELCQRLLREMKKLGIAPSLGSYYYVLSAERKKPFQDIKILYETMNDLKKGVCEFVLQHPSDILFFHSAMDLARFKRKGDIAKDLLDLVVNNGLQHLLGAKSSSFFGNYLCAIARNAPDLEVVFREYERIVPKYVIPRDWVFQQILLAVGNHKSAEHVPKLYTDMVSMRVRLSERVANALYAAMDTGIPKERAEEFLRVVKDSTKWMEVFRVPMTSDILSTTIKVFCLNEDYEEARRLMDESKQSDLTPSVSAVEAIFKLNLSQEDKQAAMHTLQFMAEKKMKLSEKMEKIIKENVLLAEKSEKIETWFNQ